MLSASVIILWMAWSQMDNVESVSIRIFIFQSALFSACTVVISNHCVVPLTMSQRAYE